MKKIKLETKTSIDTFNVVAILGIVIAVIVFLLSRNVLFTILPVIAVILLRLFSGKIIINPGDQIMVFGLPGSGKTMLLAKIAKDNKKCGRYIFVNRELDHLKIKDGVIDRDDIGKYSFGTRSRSGVLLYDECSLNGFDNRDYKTNFKGYNGERILEGFKKCRHRFTGIVYANQGYDELDKKIRSGLIKSCYWVKNKGLYSVAIKLTKDIKIDDITGEPLEMYIKPSIMDRLFNPSCYIYIFHKIYGRLYDTINDNTTFYLDKYKYDIDESNLNINSDLFDNDSNLNSDFIDDDYDSPAEK